MILYPEKRIWGLIGAPRSGKHTVAKFLQETRNFASYAFGDKIKEEFGIGIDEFDAAKSTDKIDGLRKKLWEFSAIKRDKDPLYFIRKVMDDVKENPNSCIIVDIRTQDELKSFFDNNGSKIYFVMDFDNGKIDIDENGYMTESRIHRSDISGLARKGRLKHIHNHSKSGIFKFLKELEQLFFMEEIMDLSDSPRDKPEPEQIQQRLMLKEYIAQFNIIEK